MTTKKIRVLSTMVPDNRPSEVEWMKEFNVGRMFFDCPNDVGLTWGDFIRELKRTTPCTDPQILVGTNS